MKKLSTLFVRQPVLILKAYAHKYYNGLLVLVIFFAGLPSLVIAQPMLPSFVDSTKPGVVDYIIPSNVTDMYVTVSGAQGGNIQYGCSAQGGLGLTYQAHFLVSYCSSRIVPGGTLRLITGGRGESVRVELRYAGGGGGGSALLYKAPSGSDWIILVASGGGGGAFTGPFNEDCSKAFPGQNATIYTAGGGTKEGPGGIDGNGGSGVTFVSYGGGGAFSDGVTGANQGCTGKAGFPNGGAEANCNDIFTTRGGFGFGSGGAGVSGGAGGGGYSGGGGGIPGGLVGGGGGGSYLSSWYTDWDRTIDQTGDGKIVILCGTGILAHPVGLESSTLPGLQVTGCNVNNNTGFGFSTVETTTTLNQFTAAGGKITSGSCSVQSVTYIDSLDPVNPTKVVNRTYTVTDGGNNKARCKQVITIVDPGIAATISPASQTTCVNVKPAAITVNALSQFGITIQWYKGDNAIFSESTIIPGATSSIYSPPAIGIADLTYYFAKITDGCGLLTVKKATVNVQAQPLTWYKDADNDNYYDPSIIGQSSCTSPGPGFKYIGLLGADCNDNDATYNPQTVWVLDADGDGYYSGDPYTGCLFIGATGYVRKTTQLPGDCNDNVTSIHPGGTEVLNGIDDNCDGKIDEGTCGVATNLTVTNITQSSASISWNSALNGIKYRLSYKPATAATWTVINNINATIYNLTGLSLYTTYNYKVQTLCAFNAKSIYSKVSSFTTTYGGPAYCTTNGNSTYEYIDKVILGPIKNTSGSNNGYGDYTNLSANLAAGSIAQIKLTPGFYTGPYTEYWEVYIDYNHDGLFKTQDGEKVAAGHNTGTLSRSFTIPLTAKTGYTRMRVMMHYGASLNQPCGSYVDGEAEDYTVNITGGTIAVVESEATEASNISSILVIPNPVNSYSATAVLNVIKQGNASVRITDLSGRTLYKKDVTNLNTGKNPVALTGLAALTNGIYLIEAQQNGTIIGRGKVVVEK